MQPDPTTGLRRGSQPASLSDAALAVSVREGDRSAFATLVRRHLPRVLAIARRLVGNDTDAQDIAQDVFARLWQNIAALEIDDRGLLPWLARVAANGAMDHHRRQKDQSHEATELLVGDNNQQRTAEQNDLARKIDQALQALPDRQRVALVLFHYEQFSLQETARSLDISPEAVESLLARARRRLRADLADTWRELLPDAGL